MNCQRLLNVVFGDICHPHLATPKSTLSRDKLDVGKKQDQVFYKLLAREYNREDVLSYDDISF